MNWYKVEVIMAHKGAGNDQYNQVYVYASDINDVLNRYKKMRGIKRQFPRRFFPNIFPICEEESTELEKRIEEEGRISLDHAKRTWYYREIT